MELCATLNETNAGFRLVVTTEEGCSAELVAHEDMSPGQSIPFITSSGSVELRDGSKEFPIELPNLQSRNNASVEALLTKGPSGELCYYKPIPNCIDQKVVSRDGLFLLSPDVVSQFINDDLCEVSSHEEFDYFIGAKEITVDCGGSPTTLLRMVKIPKELLNN